MSGKTDMLAWGSNWLEEERDEHLTRTVVYVRGEDSVSIAATFGRVAYRVEGNYGILERHEVRDYLVLAADLVLDGAEVLPQPGDRIRETVGDTVHVYEVMPIGGEPCWRYSDDFRQTLRIHSKHVDTEVVS